MGKLWQDVVEILGRRPLLWVPVLVADLLCYLAILGRNSVLHAVVSHETAHQSALGGAVIHGSMTAGAFESTTILALLLTWLVYFVRLVLYAGAFVATAALVEAVKERSPEPIATIGPSLARYRGGVLELALRALSAYAVFALLFSWISSFLTKHGHTVLAHNAWFNFGASSVVPFALAALLPPVALRVIAGRGPDRETAAQSRLFALTLMVVLLLLSFFVNSNSRELAQVTPAARYPLEVIGSLLVALPYAPMFTGLALLARRLKLANE